MDGARGGASDRRGEDIVAVAWYHDGEREELTGPKFAVLVTHAEWLVQVLRCVRKS